MANPIIAAIASFIIPGIGQIYAGDVKRGIMFMIIVIIFHIIGHFTTGTHHIISVVATLIYRVFIAYDAYKVAQ